MDWLTRTRLATYLSVFKGYVVGHEPELPDLQSDDAVVRRRQPAQSLFKIFSARDQVHVHRAQAEGTPGTIDEDNQESDSERLCPVSCPPPNPTECDGVPVDRWKTLLDKESVAIHRKSSHSVQVVGSSRGNSF